MMKMKMKMKKEIRKLLKAGADINTRDSEGQTCLMKTAPEGRLEASKLLIEKKAEINMKDRDGYTVLFVTERTEPYDKHSKQRLEKMVSLLIENGAESEPEYMSY